MGIVLWTMDRVAPACSPTESAPLCPSSALMDFLGRRHMLHLLRAFGTKPVLRFTELRRELRSSPNTLAARLDELVDEGILDREVFPVVPPRVDYRLTDKGRELLARVMAFDDFLDHYGPLGRERTKARPRPERVAVARL